MSRRGRTRGRPASTLHRPRSAARRAYELRLHGRRTQTGVVTWLVRDRNDLAPLDGRLRPHQHPVALPLEIPQVTDELVRVHDVAAEVTYRERQVADREV